MAAGRRARFCRRSGRSLGLCIGLNEENSWHSVSTVKAETVYQTLQGRDLWQMKKISKGPVVP